MTRREIARDEWQAFFDAFNGQHEGWLVGVDRFDEFLDETVETRHLDGALRGFQSDEGLIALAVDDRSSGHLETESIQHPQRIVLEQSEDEMDTALEIDGVQSCLILRFHEPIELDMPPTFERSVRLQPGSWFANAEPSAGAETVYNERLSGRGSAW